MRLCRHACGIDVAVPSCCICVSDSRTNSRSRDGSTLGDPVMLTRKPLRHRKHALLLFASLALGACASLPHDRGRSDVIESLASTGHSFVDAGDAGSDLVLAERLSEPLDAGAAVELAWIESPRVRLTLAELGLAAADLFESGRLRNPTISGSRLGGHDGKTTIGVGVLISDLITLPARSRIGRARWQAAISDAANALLDEAAATRADYYRHVGAQQVAALREAIAEAADASAELARRFHAAGNISELQLAREEAAATVARTDAAKARAARFATRMALAERLGLAGRSNRWHTQEQLPMPPETVPDIDELLANARANRHDVAAARELLEAGEDAARLARRFRWLGDVEFGFEREREDGHRESGPTLSLQLPLFQQGQAGIARAEALRDAARERLALHELAIERDVRNGVERLATQRDVVLAYRDALIPQRETIVAREQERYNFMLIGAFELIQARQQEYDAYQSYLEAIRDYWLARTELARAVGGQLPDDGGALPAAPGVDDLLAPKATMSHDHSRPATGNSANPPARENEQREHGHHRHHGDTP